MNSTYGVINWHKHNGNIAQLYYIDNGPTTVFTNVVDIAATPCYMYTTHITLNTYSDKQLVIQGYTQF